jgi:TRAP-type transport system periplasmic protein
VIVLQMPDQNDPDGLFFAQDVGRRSHGSLRVVVDASSYPNTLPSNEARLVAAMRAGTVGFGYLPARDWAAVGLPGFEAVDSPFLVTTVSASEALTSSPIAKEVLGELSSLGLVGIGMIPSEPRQIESTRPLFGVSAFRGIRLRIIDNPETAGLVAALGARPLQGPTASQVRGLLLDGSVTGVETNPTSILSNSYNAEAPYLTSYAVIPKLETVVATRAAWDGLSAGQQIAVREAVTDTLVNARQVAEREIGQLLDLCANGLVVDQPSPAQLAALADEAGAAAPRSAAAVAFERNIRAAVPGTGAEPTAFSYPSNCQVAHSVPEAINRHRLSIPRSSVRPGARIPPGTYVTTDTVADWVAGDLYGPDWSVPVTYTWHLYADGTLYQTQKPVQSDQPFGRGRYVVNGDEVTFIWDPYMQLTPETVRWSYFDGQLSFSIVSVQDAGSRVIYTAHPWQKVG